MHVFPFCSLFALLDRCKDGQQVPQRNFSSNHVLGFECRPLVGVNSENKSFLALHVACVQVGSNVGYQCYPRTSDCFTCKWFRSSEVPSVTKMTLVLNCTLALFVTRIWFGSQRPTAMCAGGLSGFEADNRGGALLLCQAGDGAALPPVAAATGAMLAPELGGQRGSARIWSK